MSNNNTTNERKLFRERTFRIAIAVITCVAAVVSATVAVIGLG